MNLQQNAARCTSLQTDSQTMYSVTSTGALSGQGHRLAVLVKTSLSYKGSIMKKLIVLFALLAAGSLAQAQNTGALANHPEARNDRMPSSHAVSDNRHRVGKKVHHHGKKHHHRKHRRAM